MWETTEVYFQIPTGYTTVPTLLDLWRKRRWGEDPDPQNLDGQ